MRKVWCACMHVHFPVLAKGVFNGFVWFTKGCGTQNKMKNRGSKAKAAFLKLFFMGLNGLHNINRSSYGYIHLGNMV